MQLIINFICLKADGIGLSKVMLTSLYLESPKQDSTFENSVGLGLLGSNEAT